MITVGKTGKTQAKKSRRVWEKERNRRRKRAKEQNPPFVLCAKTGKVRHKNADYAVKALARIVGRHPGRDRECRYYQCPHCRGYHLTSQLSWRKQK